MKSSIMGAAAISAMLVAGSAVAQTTPTNPTPATPAAPAPAQAATPAPAKVAIPAGVFFRGQTASQFLARDRLIGAPVHDKDGKIIGDIEDIIFNTEGQIDGVIMGVGGFLGAGEKKVGVRYSALKIDRKDAGVYISLPQATKDILAALEPYKRAEPRKSWIDRAKEKAQELTDKTKDSETLKKAQELGKAAYDKTKELGGAAIEKGKQVIEQAKDAAKPAEAPKQ